MGIGPSPEHEQLDKALFLISTLAASVAQAPLLEAGGLRDGCPRPPEVLNSLSLLRVFEVEHSQSIVLHSAGFGRCPPPGLCHTCRG